MIQFLIDCQIPRAAGMALGFFVVWQVMTILEARREKRRRNGRS